jgi:sec-independent protein translocase protein TatB
VFDIGAGEFIGLALLGLLLFGPDRLPAIAADLARTIGKVRSFATSATSELKENLGPELTSLNDFRPDRLASDFGKSLLDPDTKRKEARIDPDAT